MRTLALVNVRNLDKQDQRLIIIKVKIIIYEQIIRNGQIIKRLIIEISK